MGEGLWKVSEMPVGCGIELLGVESDVVREAKQLLEQLLGLVHASHFGVAVHQPERAHEEQPLSRRQSIVDLGGAIAADQPESLACVWARGVELTRDAIDRREHARV